MHGYFFPIKMHKSRRETINNEFVVNKMKISNQEIQEFKKTYGLLEDVTMSFQSITPSNTLSVQGREYFLNDIVTSLPIFTKDATYIHNAIAAPFPKVNMFQEEYEQEIVTVVKNMDDDIESVRIIDKIKNEIVDLKSISPGIFATIKESDYNAKDHIPSHHRRIQENNSCVSYDIIELAVAYDSSFCSFYEGQAKSDLKVYAVVKDVSTKFLQLCVKVYLSHLEGYCNSASDPYKQYVDLNLSGCGNDGLLDGVQTYWNANRVDVNRDAMILFSGTTLECHELSCTHSCSHIGSICNNNFAYGAVHISFSPSENLEAVLVASELGHICGAAHTDSTGYIMYEFPNAADLGFDDDNIQLMQDRFGLTECVTTEGTSLPPITQIPTITTTAPSHQPSIEPSNLPSSLPSLMPSITPTISLPTAEPSNFASREPTIQPTRNPTKNPSKLPSALGNPPPSPSSGFNLITCITNSFQNLGNFLVNFFQNLI